MSLFFRMTWKDLASEKGKGECWIRKEGGREREGERARWRERERGGGKLRRVFTWINSSQREADSLSTSQLCVLEHYTARQKGNVD